MSPEDFVIAETNLRGFVQLMKSEGIFIGHTDRLDDECFHAAHRRLKRSSILAQVTLWPFWPSHLMADQDVNSWSGSLSFCPSANYFVTAGNVAGEIRYVSPCGS